MSDPHVRTLYYDIEHDEHVDYSDAAPFECDRPDFSVRVEAGEAVVSMKSHFASADEAQAAVAPFLRSWEVDMALRYGPGSLRVIYKTVEIIDRDPSPGVVTAYFQPAHFALTGGSVRAIIGFGKWPEPPAGMTCDPIVELMFARYVLYRKRGTLLADAANYCLTCLEMGGKLSRAGREGEQERRSAAAHYRISMAVLRKIGELAESKGGTEARKAHVASDNFTGRERQWLETAMTVLIRRAAEVAYDANACHRIITMADLPELTSQSAQ